MPDLDFIKEIVAIIGTCVSIFIALRGSRTSRRRRTPPNKASKKMAFRELSWSTAFYA